MYMHMIVCVCTYVVNVLFSVLCSQSGATPDYQFVCGSQVSYICTYISMCTSYSCVFACLCVHTCVFVCIRVCARLCAHVCVVYTYVIPHIQVRT